MSDITSDFAHLSVNEGKVQAVHDEKKAAVLENAPTFVTKTIPNVDHSTRIIAVCGITDVETVLDTEDWHAPNAETREGRKTGEADPEYDGWFFSDYFAFKHCLKGTGASQIWLTSEAPEKLVSRYSQYLHGNPYYERKVVLNQEMLKTGVRDNVKVTARESLRSEFKNTLHDEAQLARESKQSLLVLIFGHGNCDTKGILLGPLAEKNWFTMKDFSESVGDGINTTLMTTACFSGGWSVNLDLNISTSTAAGPTEESESWTASPSCGRYCGSIYVSALLKAWSEECQEAKTDTSKNALAQPKDTEIQKSFAAFTSAVYDTLLKFDRFGDRHHIHFSAQDDDWASARTDRTGIPLVDFEKVWNSLPSFPASADPQSGLNRAHKAGAGSSSNETDTRVGSLRARFQNAGVAFSHFRIVAKMYLDSHPGRDSLGTNTALHGFLRQFLNRKRRPTAGNLQWAYNQLEYRNNLMTIATELLMKAGIPFPLGSTCSEFDLEKFESNDKHGDVSKKYGYAIGKIAENILPSPDQQQGHDFRKPHKYIAAALACCTSLGSPAAMDQVIIKLERIHDQNVKYLKKDLDRNEVIRGRKQTWFSGLGKRLRSLSPEKRKNKRAGMPGGSWQN